ncbi:MAG: hypothetical protein Q4P29_07690 [Tissierellia bacterium]|nr:hypothetical protein [Tissierellia bacterium]
MRDVVKRLNLKRYDNISEFISQNQELSREELIAEINFRKLLDESDEKKSIVNFYWRLIMIRNSKNYMIEFLKNE